jgi:hypothetical protein
MDNGTRVSGGQRPEIDVPLGTVSPIGEITVDASTVSTAKKLDLVVSLRDREQQYTNRWSFWVYPRTLAGAAERPVVSRIRWENLRQKYPWMLTNASTITPEALLISEELDSRAVTHLRAGGRVWLMLPQTPERRGTPFFPAAGGAFGTVIPAHAATRRFPNEGFCDLQFYNLLNGAFPLPVDQWPVSPEAIIGGIRTMSEFLSKTKNLSRVAYAVEGNALGGKLLITTLRLREHLDDGYPEALAFFDSILRYASGSAFSPRASVPEQVVQRLTSE